MQQLLQKVGRKKSATLVNIVVHMSRQANKLLQKSISSFEWKIGKEETVEHLNVVFHGGNSNKGYWYIDSGTSIHITANETWIKNQ